MQRHEGGYYIRLTVPDRPGAAAGIATRMAEADISLESIVQSAPRRPPPRTRTASPARRCPLVLITYATTEAAIRSALDTIAGDGLISEPPQVIRIERRMREHGPTAANQGDEPP